MWVCGNRRGVLAAAAVAAAAVVSPVGPAAALVEGYTPMTALKVLRVHATLVHDLRRSIVKSCLVGTRLDPIVLGNSLHVSDYTCMATAGYLPGSWFRKHPAAHIWLCL